MLVESDIIIFSGSFKVLFFHNYHFIENNMIYSDIITNLFLKLLLEFAQYLVVLLFLV